MYVYECVCVCVCVCVHVCVLLCVYVCVHMCVCVFLRLHMHARFCKIQTSTFVTTYMVTVIPESPSSEHADTFACTAFSFTFTTIQ